MTDVNIDRAVADAIDPPEQMTIAGLQKMIGDWGKRKGWTFDLISTPEKIALMHSELSEALEEYRKGLPPHVVHYTPTENGPKPEGIGIELADCMIRILHYADNFGIDMQAAILEKMAFNEKRPYRHGNLRA